MTAAIAYCKKWSDRTFLFQTKNPRVFLAHEFPENVIFDVTIESDVHHPVSYAPDVYQRHRTMTSEIIQRRDNKIWITIEPIMEFNNDFASWLEEIHPEVVYLGYDSKNHNLTEPSLEQTKELITQIERFAEVRTKLLRKAHWE
jgi:DNA repair photolyase